MNKTFIFGHKKPDTDSVMSAIGLSYVKNELGEETEPKVLGDINKETSFALDYFKLNKPEYLNDVKLQIKNVKYFKDVMMEEDMPIYEGYQYMLKEGVTGLPIVDKDKKFVGLVTLKDLSHILLDDNMMNLDTSYDNIVKILKGEEVLKIDDEIKAEIYVASYKSTRIIETFDFNEDMALIVGDRHSVIENAINSKVKLIVITGNSEIKEEHLKLAKKNKVNIIKTSLHTYNVSRVIILSNYLKTTIKVFTPIIFNEHTFATDAKEIIEKNKFTNYPVVNKNGVCLGLLVPDNLNSKNPKKVTLVDHNEKLQTADGIDEAEIIEIFDHHNIGSVTTNQPINFRNMAVGSTCTIVYILAKEKGIKLPKAIAGALLSGILSDTLILRSPTKTKFDEEAVEELSKIAKVDYEKYGLELLKSGTSLEGMSEEDVLFNDYKMFKAGDKEFSVGQFFTMNFEEIESKMDDYIKVLDKVAEQNNFAVVALYVTDIIKNGSYVLYNKKAQNIMDIAYNTEVKEGYFVEGCVSRKKNVVPVIMGVLE